MIPLRHGISLALDTVPDAADLQQIASWRFAHVRLTVDETMLAPAAGWAALDAALAHSIEQGLRAVLALRADQEGIWRAEPGWQGLVALWEQIARRYRAWPEYLVYDLLDRPAAPDNLPPEALAALGAARLSPAAARRPQPPGATGSRAWNALAQQITRAVRAVDPDRWLVVQANGGGPAGFTHLRPTRDPRTAYGFRFFAPAAFTLQGSSELLGADVCTASVPRSLPPAGGLLPGSGASASSFLPPAGGDREGGVALEATPEPISYPGVIAGERWDRVRLLRELQPVLEFRSTYEAPVYLTAFGVSAAAPRSGQLTWLRSLLSLCREHHIGWAYWAYRGYPFGLVCESEPCLGLAQYQNPQRLDYDRLSVLQTEA